MGEEKLILLIVRLYDDLTNSSFALPCQGISQKVVEAWRSACSDNPNVQESIRLFMINLHAPSSVSVIDSY
jgi:hypothetical protein